RYAAGIEETAPFRVRAVAPNVGAGAIAALRLEKDVDAEAPDLRLKGPGTISGVVRFADGAPVGRVAVMARPEGNHPSSGGYAEADAEDPDRGLVRTTATSAPDGRFALSGLPPGRY